MTSGPRGKAKRKKGLASFAEARLGFAIGDVHGRADLLDQMLLRIAHDVAEANSQNAIVIFMGDYVDRGPDSAEVIAHLLSQQPPGIEWRFLKGNHEQSMLNFLDGPTMNRGWLAHGGLETLVSYGVSPLPSIGSSAEAIVQARDQLKQNMPASHLAFLQSLERFVIVGDYLFVHAGVDTSLPIERQRDDDLFWVRGKFLNDTRAFSHVVVHGHTPVTTPYRDHRRICVDTGAYATGRLCAARFFGDSVTFLIEERVKMASPSGGD
ncbi:metallophosphoesterase family protein [Terricaulis silvestris]|uniref:Bis(5'-nucleosyl)-tetraphosphatase PrpE n=1 Tax=Terricaulis silvestris TaxID=2686094 RepID=A0A6I6MI80_9CAUL|nr:metallophosphoesterase family protein [Terricaulis silvestris]QGZ93371.1 Bis(5'-nucleosyl)-tetraphosphatase PrpE [Terricaulis silvestris]